MKSLKSNYVQERKKELQKNQFSAPFPATFYGAENADLFEYTILWQLIRWDLKWLQHFKYLNEE